MKCQISACLLLLWTLTAYVSCNEDSSKQPEIKVKTISDAIELSCGDKHEIQSESGKRDKSMKLTYQDDNTGEYTCLTPGNYDDTENVMTETTKIYVKFRTCDNCIELNVSSVAGIAVGNVLATIVIGVAVYLIASQTRIGPTTSHKKSSDRQHLVLNEVSNRAPNDHYQPLTHKGGQRDMYDVLTNRR